MKSSRPGSIAGRCLSDKALIAPFFAKTYLLAPTPPPAPPALGDWRARHDKSYAIPDLNLVVIDCDSEGQVLSTEHARHGFTRWPHEHRFGFARLKNAALIEDKDL